MSTTNPICDDNHGGRVDVPHTHPLPGYREHDHATEWQECDCCGLRLGAGVTTSWDEQYYAGDPADCPRCNGLMCLPDYGTLHDYEDGSAIRPATKAERDESVAAAELDGGAGVIRVDGRRCYVQD